MAKGSNAKAEVINKIKNLFGDDYVGEFDKKIIVWANDGTEKIQVALALTCPKTVYGENKQMKPAIAISNGGFDFTAPVPQPAERVDEISAEEMAEIEKLRAKFSL